MNLSLGVLLRSSLPITGQLLPGELTGRRSYCCRLGQTAAAFRVSYLCATCWLSIPAEFLLEDELLSHTVVQYWYFASECVSDIFAGSLQVLCSRFPKVWNFLGGTSLHRWYTNLALQEAAFHTIPGLSHFTPHCEVRWGLLLTALESWYETILSLFETLLCWTCLLPALL